MARNRIKYERLLYPALAFSAACHLLAALVPAGALDVLIHRESGPQRAAQLEVVELREEPMQVVASRVVETPPAPRKKILGTPPLPRLRETDGPVLLATKIGVQPSEPALEPENAPAAQTAPPAPEIDQDSLARLENYISDIAARIEQARRYPETARRMGQQGEVQVAFAIGRDGGLRRPARLVEPSRYGSLNRAACNSVLRSTPFPPLPACYNHDTLDITVRIVFELQ